MCRCALRLHGCGLYPRAILGARSVGVLPSSIRGECLSDSICCWPTIDSWAFHLLPCTVFVSWALRGLAPWREHKVKVMAGGKGVAVAGLCRALAHGEFDFTAPPVGPVFPPPGLPTYLQARSDDACLPVCHSPPRHNIPQFAFANI